MMNSQIAMEMNIHFVPFDANFSDPVYVYYRQTMGLIGRIKMRHMLLVLYDINYRSLIK